MKKLMVLLLAVLWMLSGCTIVIVDPFATAPAQEVTVSTEPSAYSTEVTEEPTIVTEAPTEETGPVIPEGGGLCTICGLPYAEGEGFESLCFVCQEKYGPKCSVCGTDCTYRGTVEGMCDDCFERICYFCGRRGFMAEQMVGSLCYNCSADDITCAQCGRDCDAGGWWVGSYFCCPDCGVKTPCALCGEPYYLWDMFEGVCFSCNDPSGGEAGGGYGWCRGCGVTLRETERDGYCYYCHPDFGFICSKCGYQQPGYSSERGWCYNCEQEG